MDGKAYMEPDSWQVLLDEYGYNLINLRDKRYDAVIHLVTAADGAEEFYNLDNNLARYEVNGILLYLWFQPLACYSRANRRQGTSIKESETLGLDIHSLCNPYCK